MATPTPAQLAAADLIEVTTYQEIEAAYADNRGPLRTFLDGKFPPVTHGYVKPPIVTPPPPVEVTVTFDSEGGSAVASATVTVGSSIDAPINPTYTGFNFEGWSMAPGGTPAVFPFVVTENVTLYAEWTAVVVPPPPPPTLGPSGFAHPVIPADMKETLWDDFNSTTMGSKWGGPGGAGKNAEGAFWAPWHIVYADSCLNLCAYPDTSLVGQWGVTAQELAASNNWVAAELGTNSDFPLGPGTRILTAIRADSMPGLTAIALVTGLGVWPPEGDFVEINAPLTAMQATIHHNPNNSQIPSYTQAAGLKYSLTEWMVWGIQWDAETIEFLVQLTPDGPLTVWATVPTPTDGSWAKNMFLSFQYQTNDPFGAVEGIVTTPQFPAADSSVTAENPLRQQMDWVQVCSSTAA